jgi:uncharacterized protein
MIEAWALIGFAGAVAGGLLALMLLRGRHPLAAATVVILVALGVWALFIEPERLVVREVAVDSREWSGPPIRIGVISDTHVGSAHGRVSRVRELVERMNAERPDLVVLLGDYAGSHESATVRSAPRRSAVQQGVEAFGALKAPLGVYAVIGNHDVWYGQAAIEAALDRARIPTLVNAGLLVERGDQRFWLGGLAEISRSAPSVRLALSGAPADAPALLLTHYPDPFAAAPYRPIALTLAAHSHCGQVNLPIVGRLVASSPGSARWPCGLYDQGGRKLFVSGGVGTSILPLRFGCPPEIDVVTLRGG